MSISVHLYARYAELFGAPRIEIPVDRAGTIGAIVGYLRGLPGGSSLPERPFVAVNMAQVDLDYRPAAGDEIAFLPPMAGG